MDERVIIHSDFNNFYANIECLYEPSLRKTPLAVTGSVEARHGIVLSKNDLAKKAGVKTGMAIWQARQKCPDIRLVTARHDLYIHYSKLARDIYLNEFTPQVEPFGLDECWLDVTGSRLGGGKEIADKIRDTMKAELGLTVSVGVSFNKVFAKLGSDIKKPDATTVISKDDYRDILWRLPVSELLNAGPATTRKLKSCWIKTIGDLAKADPEFIYALLGKNGIMLWQFANGRDTSSVCDYQNSVPVIKTIGNSTTTPRDLLTEDDIKITLYSLSESVSSRLRDQNCLCSTVQVSIRDNELHWFERQQKLPAPACTTQDIFDAAFSLVMKNLPDKPIRSLSVRACGLSARAESLQLSLFPEDLKMIRRHDLDCAIDKIRDRFGYHSIKRGIAYLDPSLSLDAKSDNIQGGFLVENRGMLRAPSAS
jgi:DNA polymerase-4